MIEKIPDRTYTIIKRDDDLLEFLTVMFNKIQELIDAVNKLESDLSELRSKLEEK